MKGKEPHSIFQLGDKLVSGDVLTEKFVCDLDRCKGACCVHGDAGALLEEKEVKKLEEIYPRLEPYLRQEGKKAIERQGPWVVDDDGEKVTPLIDKKECAYTYLEGGIYKCAFEKAYLEGKTDFVKPVSCHLYPVRIKQLSAYRALNYDRWEICKPATIFGDKLDVPVFRFVKEGLIRKYGEDFYQALERAFYQMNMQD